LGVHRREWDLLSAQIAMFYLFFFLFLCAFSLSLLSFAFCFLYSCTTSPLSCCLFIRYMYLLDELRSAQCLSDIGGWHHRYFFLY
jgi:hypothetical protein